VGAVQGKTKVTSSSAQKTPQQGVAPHLPPWSSAFCSQGWVSSPWRPPGWTHPAAPGSGWHGGEPHPFDSAPGSPGGSRSLGIVEAVVDVTDINQQQKN